MPVIACAVSFNGHDSSVSFARDGEIVLVLEAERVFRVKRKACDAFEMLRLIEIGARLIGARPDEVDHWAMTSQGNPWLAEAARARLAQTDWFWDSLELFGRIRPVLVVSHHYAHAAAYFLGPFERALVQTCDGGGDFTERLVVFRGDGLELNRLDDATGGVTGMPYGLVARFFYGEGFAEGKLMAVAGLEGPCERFVEIADDLLSELNNGAADIPRGAGLDEMNAGFAAGLDRCQARLETALGRLRGQSGLFGSEARRFVSTFQAAFARRRLEDLTGLIGRHGAEALVLSGGVCLNLGANRKIHDALDLPLFIPPNCDDSGQSMGALAKLVVETTGRRPMGRAPFLGAGEAAPASLDDIPRIAERLSRGETILLHQGRAEIGPRALGHRSLLGRADSLAKKQELSETIKRREAYRPVAPIMRKADAARYFIGPSASPFMLYSYDVRPQRAEEVCGALHADGTARAQTVTADSDPFVDALLEAVGERDGTPVLLNTSLNLRGQPIANAPEDTHAIADHCRGLGLNVSVVMEGRLVDVA